MTYGVGRPPIRPASTLLLAVLLTVTVVACIQQASGGVATTVASKEATSANTNPSPIGPQIADDPTTIPRADKEAASTKTNRTPVDPEDAGVRYAQCIRDNGVPNFPDPGPDGRFAISHAGDGIDHDDPKLRAALELCRALAPGGEHRNTGDPAYVEQMREFSQCMRDNGLPDFPDPDADGRLRGLGHEQQVNPKFRAATQACAKVLPGGGAHR